MYDASLVIEILNQIKTATEIIAKRFQPIISAEDFYNSEAGSEKLDAICMQLIAIGKSLKNLDKITGGKLLLNYPEIDWRGAKGMRDIISHHYFDIDAEIVFEVCKNKIPDFAKTINLIVIDLKK